MFVMVTQVALVYGFGFFLIELDFFYSLFFYHIVKKIILEKNHVIKLYEVIKIKIYRGNHYSPNTYCIVDYNSNQQWFAFFFLCF
jgi:hypothetical protein